MMACWFQHTMCLWCAGRQLVRSGALLACHKVGFVALHACLAQKPVSENILVQRCNNKRVAAEQPTEGHEAEMAAMRYTPTAAQGAT
jgi:hypothetical protein